MLADADVNEDEAKFLLEWLGKNRMASDVLMPVLYSRLKDIFQDGVMDNDEPQDLLSFLKHGAGKNTVLEDMTSMLSSLPLDNPQPQVVFIGHVSCFTGNFALGPRETYGQEVVSRGGIFKNTIANNSTTSSSAPSEAAAGFTPPTAEKSKRPLPTGKKPVWPSSPRIIRRVLLVKGTSDGRSPTRTA